MGVYTCIGLQDYYLRIQGLNSTNKELGTYLLTSPLSEFRKAQTREIERINGLVWAQLEIAGSTTIILEMVRFWFYPETSPNQTLCTLNQNTPGLITIYKM